MTQFVRSADGVKLAVVEWGNPAGPEVVLIHGAGQSHLCFAKQRDSELARDFRLIAFDLRGHGGSDKPGDAPSYQNGRVWADDVAAVLDAKRLKRPVLVGWSLGARVVRQYLMHYGDARIGGVNFVSTRPFEDPAVLATASRNDIAGRPDTLAAQIDAHIAFLRACFLRQPAQSDFFVALAYNAIVPQPIREAISGWSTGLEETRAALRRVCVPVLVTHGRDDALILPSAAEMTAAAIDGARISWYEDCGHSPFYEHAARFNRELDAFVAAIEAHDDGRRRA